jgi:hypothetical protein
MRREEIKVMKKRMLKGKEEEEDQKRVSWIQLRMI